MPSPSSTKDLAKLPTGTRVFIDANIFIYHFTHTPLTTACTSFLQRVETGDLHGVTSAVVLAEVAHRLMILEAIQTVGLPARTAVRKLKTDPSLILQLSQYKVVTAANPDFNVVVEPVTFAHLQAAQTGSTSSGLLTNDSLSVAVMQVLALTDIASNDADLAGITGLTLWQPRL